MSKEKYRIKELSNEVNQLDLKCGLNLKKLKHLKMTEVYAYLYINFYKILLLYIIWIADIDSKSFFKKKDSHRILKRFITVEYLKKHSSLFDGEKPSSTSDMKFRKQFYCILMIRIMNRMDEIVMGLIVLENDKLSLEERKIIYLKQVVKELLNLTEHLYTDKNDFCKDVLSMYEKISLRYSNLMVVQI